MSKFHRRTAYQRDSMSGGPLDWANQPHPFKTYQHREITPLPSPRFPGAGFADLALSWPPPPAQGSELDLESLAGLLLLSGGVTAVSSGHALRAQASAGALFPNELYLAVQDQHGLPDGLYHFAAQGPGLHHLYEAPLARVLSQALGAEPASLTFLISAIFWRSLWKYRTRAYRYCLLDGGHLLANLELAAAAHGLSPMTSLDFGDAALNQVLGFDPQEEVALCALSMGEQIAPNKEDPPSPPNDLNAMPLSAQPKSDPAIIAAHEEGCLERPRQEPIWPQAQPRDRGEMISLPSPSHNQKPLQEVIARRRSRRNFVDQPLRPRDLAFLLKAALPAAGPLGATVALPPGEDWQGGVYDYLPQEPGLIPRQAPADPREHLALASLHQMWVGQAGLVLVLWADLAAMADMAGPRAYRHAMIAAGRAGQLLYLGATALGLGCCGVGAFFDDEVIAAVGLPPGASPLYLLACGPIKGGLG